MMPAVLNPEVELRRDIGALAEDPLGFVMFAFPWNTEPSIQIVPWDPVVNPSIAAWSARFPTRKWGPDAWFCQFLDDLAGYIRERKFDGRTAVTPIRMAVASGAGIGKGAGNAMLCNFLLSRGPCKGRVTANTGTQLRTQTWAEMVKWHKLSITSHWFDDQDSTMTIKAKCDPENWRIDCVSWQEHKSQAFAGLHCANGSPVVVMDESSTVPDAIAEVAERLTDGEPFIFKYGNPTENQGHFFRAFHGERHRWDARQIDSRQVFITNKTAIQELVDDFGEDSDIVRIRVRGVFPRASARQFISTEIVEVARKRTEVFTHRTDPIIIGVDVAREGDDESVIGCRIGLDARSFPMKVVRTDDLMALVGHVTLYTKDLMQRGLVVDQIAIDPHGMGVGVYDRLNQLGYPVMAAYNWPDSTDAQFHNPNDRWWAAVRDWLHVGSIPDDEILCQQLTNRMAGFDGRNRLSLEKKADMKSRGIGSPDRADALALTFAFPVAPKEMNVAHQNPQTQHVLHEYDPFAERPDDRVRWD